MVRQISQEEGEEFTKENSKKMYFGGVHPSTTLETIRYYFSSYGPVSFCSLMAKPASNGTRFGFVIFEERQSLELILQQGKFEIEGCTVFVSEYQNNYQNSSKKVEKISANAAEDFQASCGMSTSLSNPQKRTSIFNPKLIVPRAQFIDEPIYSLQTSTYSPDWQENSKSSENSERKYERFSSREDQLDHRAGNIRFNVQVPQLSCFAISN